MLFRMLSTWKVTKTMKKTTPRGQPLNAQIKSFARRQCLTPQRENLLYKRERKKGELYILLDMALKVGLMLHFLQVAMYFPTVRVLIHFPWHFQ